MQLTLSWLKQFLRTNASLNEIITALNQCGIEVEKVTDFSQQYHPFEVAEIIEATPHPDASSLQVCKVNTDKEILQVVCGANNARAGIKVVLAPIGAIIPLNGMVIKAAKIRGVDSQGMLCSAEELSLSDESDGIIELPADTTIGMKITEYYGLNDAVIEVAITPNRGDVASIFGIARELAAMGLGSLNEIHAPTIKAKADIAVPRIDIIAKDQCWQFYGRYIMNVNNKEPIEKIAKQLKKIGCNSNSALVDISNYTMYSYGRPNHIFDADKISGDIQVRMAKEGEKFIALGGEEYILSSEILVVADAQKVLAVAGVMGGESSKVDADTKNIMIEVAQFAPEAVMIAGRKLGLHSDSRYRFERRIDPAISDLVMDEITMQVIAHCGGAASETAKEIGNGFQYVNRVLFKPEHLAQIAGFNIPGQEIKQILEALGFSYNQERVEIPSWRLGDIMGTADIVEEILRIHGYHRIPNLNIMIASEEVTSKEVEKSYLARNALLERGFIEQITWSFASLKAMKDFGFEQLISLKNPISEELSVMRASAVPNLLDKLQNNSARGESSVSFCEIGNNYVKDIDLLQEEVVTLLRSGDMVIRNVHGGQRKVDFYDIKADVFYLLEKMKCNPENFNLQPAEVKYYHPGKSASFALGKKVIGHFGELHPAIASVYGVKEPIYIAEIYIDRLPVSKNRAAKNQLKLSDYQAVYRDFAFMINAELSAGEISKAVVAINKDLIVKVEIFDVYQNKQQEAEGVKSIAIQLKLQPFDRTLKDDEINTVAEQVVNMMNHKFAATLRN